MQKEKNGSEKAVVNIFRDIFVETLYCASISATRATSTIKGKSEKKPKLEGSTH